MRAFGIEELEHFERDALDYEMLRDPRARVITDNKTKEELRNNLYVRPTMRAHRLDEEVCVRILEQPH